jgi:hypothetical protein
MKKLVAVMCCHTVRSRAQINAQRATWVKDLREQGTDVVFFLGQPPVNASPFAAQDEVWFFGCDDSYFGIPEKVRRICRWAVENGYDYVAKVDDDVYIAPRRFAALPLGADYIGRFRGPYGNYPAHFASGFTYWLSAAAAHHVGWTPSNGDWMDERFIANRLALEGIFGYNDPINYLVTGPHTSGAEIIKRPILKAGTVFCEYRADQMKEMHEVLRFAEPVPGHPGLRQVPQVAITPERFAMPPLDRVPQHKVERYMR